MPEGLIMLALEVLCGAFGVLAMLYALANRLGFDMELHRLRVESANLRSQYEERLAQIRAMGGDIEG